MIAIISPAKNMVQAQADGVYPSRPQYRAQTARLHQILKEYTPWQLETLMNINPQLAFGAFAAYQAFDPDLPGSPALLAYRGLQYQNIAALDFTPDDFAFADRHLRIVSAFYGLLRPSDGILPYRLELQCKLRVDGESLYSFWGDRLCRDLFAPGETVINLASGEYSRAFLPHLREGDRMITCDFLVPTRDRLRMLPTAAKTARGQMARYLVKNRIDDPEALKQFCWGGYRFLPRLSSPSKFTFVQCPEGED
ncbi:peroxide stress protein YaaA [Ligaoa zhengdingensis]|uniref:peroxide stress protein YaaA n=1 Tax=Ligaoa zhengdingensis TaxID=2763658 RepID=UPI0031BAD666